VSTASVRLGVCQPVFVVGQTLGAELRDGRCRPDHRVLRRDRATAIMSLGQAGAATQEPFDTEESYEHEKGARRVAQMQGALLDDFVLQVTL
jgi:hypothetical protein